MSAPDERGEAFVADVFDKWRARYVTNGIYYGDLSRLESRIDSWAEWCPGFAEVGEEHADLGEAAAEAGNDASAAEHFVRAAKYFHFGSHVWHVDEEVRERTHRRAVECYRRGGQRLDPPVTRVEAPVDGGAFDVPGNLRVPETGADAPLVILYPGLDSTKEEMASYERPLLDRGMATLAIDGPGQGESWYHQRMTPRYHAMVSDVVDHVAALDPEGVDVSRLGGWGQSLGGFYAPYAAAHDDRFDACVGFSGPFSVGPVTGWTWPVAVDQFAHACKTDSMVEIDEITERLSLRDVVDDLTVPALMITGALDTIVPAPQTERIAERAPDGEYWEFEEGLHNCINIPYRCRPAAADWLRERL